MTLINLVLLVVMLFHGFNKWLNKTAAVSTTNISLISSYVIASRMM